MAPFRNLFSKRSDVQTGLQPAEENVRAVSPNGIRPTFEKVDTTGSRASSISINKPQEPPEYKMSVVSVNGEYLPPSPPEKKGFQWSKRGNPSSASVNSQTEIEAFPISRESFDSYRRSFDISARSPITPIESQRQSLDSARIPRLPRSAVNERRFERQPPTAEEGFEDVGLNDDQKHPKKKGFFSKFGDDSETSSTLGRFHIGRKRGQSGVGEELGSIQRPVTAGSAEITEVR